MKNSSQKFSLNLVFVIALGLTTFSQITPDQLQRFLLENRYTGNAEIKEFYSLLNYKTAWIQKENTGNRDILLYTLKLSPVMALRESDYQFDFIGSFRDGTLRLKNTDDSLAAEIHFTEAALHFYNDLAYGNTKPAFDYYGLKYIPDCHNIPALLADHTVKNKLQLLFMKLTPELPEITAMENKIKSYLIVLADSNFREVTITSGKVSENNKSLILKLYQLGIIGAVNKNLPDSTLKQKVKEAQRQFSLLPDGVLRSTIRQELDIPLAERLKELNLSINYYRWLYCLIQSRSVIVVNIPAAYLKVYRSNDILLEMRMVVGKISTPTNTLTSEVNEVILYPYWHVPYSIATKELLPDIKRNPGYINANNYQVMNMSGKIVDPYSVNWNKLSRSYFPYIIRQSTGCDNALGLLKLNFYNPFGAYLHDTPGKNLFMLNKRYFSHGCMRMEKPMEMGHLILKNNHIAIDTLEQKGCLRNQSPITVQADEHMPVIIWYIPAGIDSTGRVLFYEDIYKKFDRIRMK